MRGGEAFDCFSHDELQRYNPNHNIIKVQLKLVIFKRACGTKFGVSIDVSDPAIYLVSTERISNFSTLISNISSYDEMIFASFLNKESENALTRYNVPTKDEKHLVNYSTNIFSYLFSVVVNLTTTVLSNIMHVDHGAPPFCSELNAVFFVRSRCLSRLPSLSLLISLYFLLSDFWCLIVVCGRKPHHGFHKNCELRPWCGTLLQQDRRCLISFVAAALVDCRRCRYCCCCCCLLRYFCCLIVVCSVCGFSCRCDVIRFCFCWLLKVSSHQKKVVVPADCSRRHWCCRCCRCLRVAFIVDCFPWLTVVSFSRSEMASSDTWHSEDIYTK